MKITIERHNEQVSERIPVTVDFDDHDSRPSALDALIQLQYEQLPNLAFRYGCRNGLCGVCTISVNGRPKLACRAKIKDDDHLGPMQSLPVVRDFVVRRDAVNRAIRQSVTYKTKSPISNQNEADYTALNSLNRCIECYACLSNCPMHNKNRNSELLKYGNPFTFLKIQKLIVDPDVCDRSKLNGLAVAKQLGIEKYQSDKVPQCGVGINLKKEVIEPLQLAVKALSDETSDGS